MEWHCKRSKDQEHLHAETALALDILHTNEKKNEQKHD